MKQYLLEKIIPELLQNQIIAYQMYYSCVHLIMKLFYHKLRKRRKKWKLLKITMIQIQKLIEKKFLTHFAK